MKKLPIFLLICLLIGIVACKETEDYWTQYEQWRETNESWFIEQLGAKDEKGNPIYTKVVPSWDHSIYVLMKYYNDTSLNRDAQSPYQTSTVDVIYKGMLYDGTPFDSSYLRTDSIYRTQVKQNINGTYPYAIVSAWSLFTCYTYRICLCICIVSVGDNYTCPDVFAILPCRNRSLPRSTGRRAV